MQEIAFKNEPGLKSARLRVRLAPMEFNISEMVSVSPQRQKEDEVAEYTNDDGESTPGTTVIFGQHIDASALTI